MKKLGLTLAAISGAAYAVIWLVWLRQLTLVFDGRPGTVAITAATALLASGAGHALAARLNGRPLKIVGWCQLLTVVVYVVAQSLLQPAHDLWIGGPVAEGWSLPARAGAQGLAVLALVGLPALCAGVELAVLGRLAGSHARAAAWRCWGAVLGLTAFGLWSLRAQGLGGSAFLSTVALTLSGLVALGVDRRDEDRTDPAPGGGDAPADEARGGSALAWVSGVLAAGALVATGAAARASLGGSLPVMLAVLVAWLAGRALAHGCGCPGSWLRVVLGGAAVAALAWWLPGAPAAGAGALEAVGYTWAGVQLLAVAASAAVVLPLSAALGGERPGFASASGRAVGLVAAAWLAIHFHPSRPHEVIDEALAARLHAHVALLELDAPQRVLVLEEAPAATLDAALAHPVTAVLVAARPHAHADARVAFRAGTARTLADLPASGSFDAILAGPFAPWDVGPVSAATAPVLAALADRLTDGGVLALRAPARAMGAVARDQLIKTVVRVLPYATIFSVNADTWILLAAKKPLKLSAAAWLARLNARAPAQRDLAAAGVTSPALLFGHHLATPDDLVYLLTGEELAIHTDDRPQLELTTPAARLAALRTPAAAPLIADDWEVRTRHGATLLTQYLQGSALPVAEVLPFVKHFRSERDPAELETLALALAAQPGRVDALMAAASLKRAAGDLDSGLALALAAHTAAPADVAAARSTAALALAADARERPLIGSPAMTRARATAQALVKLAPADHAAHGALGWALYRAGRYAEAEPALVRALTLVEATPGQPEELFYRAALALSRIGLKQFGAADQVLAPVDKLVSEHRLLRAPTPEQIELVNQARRALQVALWTVNNAQ